MQRAITQALAPWHNQTRDRKFLRAIELTYLKPAGSQEQAAERLGLLFGTYRYQLGKDLAQLACALWSREMSGEADSQLP